jgi:hypothetical protein
MITSKPDLDRRRAMAEPNSPVPPMMATTGAADVMAIEALR